MERPFFVCFFVEPIYRRVGARNNKALHNGNQPPESPKGLTANGRILRGAEASNESIRNYLPRK